jgi:hypothetical protein
MQRYIEQLVEDLEMVASQKPQEVYIEIPPEMEEYPVIGELALVPFKPISKWTGIDKNVFPEMWQLNIYQCKQVIEAIFKVYKNLNLDLIDKPKDIPEEYLYDVLVSKWDYPIQYLPSTVMDVEFCSGELISCVYGEYCDYCNTLHHESEDIPPEENNLDNETDFPF